MCVCVCVCVCMCVIVGRCVCVCVRVCVYVCDGGEVGKVNALVTWSVSSRHDEDLFSCL